MASSRLERIGTIYSRTKGLLKAGGMKVENRPLWYDIYETFPPRFEPNMGRSVQDIVIKPIFYEEDKLRAKFYENLERKGLFSFFASTPTAFEQFSAEFENCRKHHSDDLEMAFKLAMNGFTGFSRIDVKQKISQIESNEG